MKITTRLFGRVLSSRAIFSTYCLAVSSSALGLAGCSSHHWAEVGQSQLPPPASERVLHTDRLIIHVANTSEETQCVAYEKYRPVCFYNIRKSLENGLVRGLWPSFPEVIVGSAKDAGPSDYLLQVDVTLDALPPDDAGPGWSAGARSRFRLMREGTVLAEETLASRSRAHFPYGSPLGEGATEVVDATVMHVATAVSCVPESRPDKPKPLPQVAAREMKAPAAKGNQQAAAPAKAKPGAQSAKTASPSK
jgi:hypothetical protein